MKKYVIMIACLSMAVAAAGQMYEPGVTEQRPPLRQRLFFGGSIGLQFGTVTNIEVSPLIGIWVLPRLAFAGGPSFQYYDDPYGNTTIYGGRAIFQLDVIQNLNNLIPLGLHMGIFATGEYAALSLEKSFFTTNPDSSGRIYDGTFLLGGGISQPTGKRSRMNLSFLWTVTRNDYGIYDNPEIRIEFYF